MHASSVKIVVPRGGHGSSLRQQSSKAVLSSCGRQHYFSSGPALAREPAEPSRTLRLSEENTAGRSWLACASNTSRDLSEMGSILGNKHLC